MEVLGYPLTHNTRCFIDGGCGASVYAHTNGDGDFVLFDHLSQPWPIHDCYINRFCDEGAPSPPRFGSEVYTDQELALELARRHQEYREAARKASEDRHGLRKREISKISAESMRRAGAFDVVGYVQDIVERHAVKAFRGKGSLAEQLLRKTLGDRESQITIVNSEFKSYTAFADLHKIVLSRRMTIVADLRSIPVLGIGDVFVCDALDILPLKPPVPKRSRGAGQG